MGSGCDPCSTLTKEREHYVTDNIKLVHHIIQKNLHIQPSNPYYQDYIQEGLYGLTLAAMRYDESSENKFSTFATSYIDGYARRFRREFVSSSIRLPRSVLDILPKISRLADAGYNSNEIAEELQIPHKDIAYTISVLSPSSLDDVAAAGPDGNELKLQEMIGAEDPDYEAIFVDEHIESCIMKVAESFHSEKQEGVWLDYIYMNLFGEPVTDNVLAKKYNFSQSYVSRLLTRGKNLFRLYLREDT